MNRFFLLFSKIFLPLFSSLFSSGLRGIFHEKIVKILLYPLAIIPKRCMINTEEDSSDPMKEEHFMAVLHLNTDNFNQTVSSGKVMVDFWAPWCMPCQSLLPVIDELGEELAGKATVAKVNVDDNKAIASQFRVMSIPTVIFFVDGVEKERLIGVQPKQKYIDTLNSL